MASSLQHGVESPTATPLLDHFFRAPRVSRLFAAYIALADTPSMDSPVVRPFIFVLNGCDLVPPTTPWDHPDIVRFAVAYDRALDIAGMMRTADADLPADVRDALIESCAAAHVPSRARLRAAARIVGLHDAWTPVIPAWTEEIAEQVVVHLPSAHPGRRVGVGALQTLLQRFPTTACHLFAYSMHGAPDAAAQIVASGDEAALTIAARACRRDVWRSMNPAWRTVFRLALESTPDGCVELMRLDPWDERLLPLMVQSPAAAADAWRVALSADPPPPLHPNHWCALLDSACADPRQRAAVIGALTRERWSILPHAARDAVRRVALTDDALLGMTLAAIGSDPVLTPPAWSRPYAMVRYYAFVPHRTWQALPDDQRSAWIAASRRFPLSAAWSFRVTGRRMDDESQILRTPHACLAAIAAIAGHPPSMAAPPAVRLHALFWFVGRVLDSVRSSFVDIDEPVPLFPDDQTATAIIPDADVDDVVRACAAA